MHGRDEELLDARRAGDAAAGSALFERHFDPLYRFLRGKTEGATGVEDPGQQIFLACVTLREARRSGAGFRADRFTVARHGMYQRWRQRQRRTGDVDVGEISLADLATSPELAEVLVHAGRRKVA